MKLFFDTETTGLTVKGAPDNDPRQPRLVQLAIAVTDDEGNIRNAFSTIIKPEGFIIPEEASNIHGITNEVAKEWGASREVIMLALYGYLLKADSIICHNTSYDKVVINRELSLLDSSCMPIDESKLFCTMKASTPVCAIPNRRGTGFKWPKLTEAYEYLFGEKLAGAHDALNDVKATMRIYFELMERQRSSIREKQLSTQVV